MGGVVQDREAGVKEEFMNGEWGKGTREQETGKGQAESMKGSGEGVLDI